MKRYALIAVFSALIGCSGAESPNDWTAQTQQLWSTLTDQEKADPRQLPELSSPLKTGTIGRVVGHARVVGVPSRVGVLVNVRLISTQAKGPQGKGLINWNDQLLYLKPSPLLPTTLQMGQTLRLSAIPIAIIEQIPLEAEGRRMTVPVGLLLAGPR